MKREYVVVDAGYAAIETNVYAKVMNNYNELSKHEYDYDLFDRLYNDSLHFAGVVLAYQIENENNMPENKEAFVEAYESTRLGGEYIDKIDYLRKCIY